MRCKQSLVEATSAVSMGKLERINITFRCCNLLLKSFKGKLRRINITFSESFRCCNLLRRKNIGQASRGTLANLSLSLFLHTDLLAMQCSALRLIKSLSLSLSNGFACSEFGLSYAEEVA